MTKKNFTDQLNQAQAEWFISPETKAKVDGTTAQVNDARQIAPQAETSPNCTEKEQNQSGSLQFEAKSRRVFLLMQPSLHDALKAKAVNEHTSVNDLIHTILHDYLQEH